MNRISMQKQLVRWMALATKAFLNNWSTQQMVDHLESTRLMQRRHFLKLAGAGLTLAACSHRRATNEDHSTDLSSSRGNSPRIVILGAGFAGLTAAYHLQKYGLSCEVYEARDRVGGRVMTKNGFNKDGMFIELGAEFVDTNHTDLIDLANEFGIEIQDYTQPIPGLKEEIYFFSHKLINPEIFLDEFKKFAGLVIDDTAMIRKNKSLILPKVGHPGPREALWLDQISLQEYLQRKMAQGISKDFIELIDVMYLGMMGLETSQQSVYNLLMLMDPWGSGISLYGESDESKRILGGNSRLVEALWNRVEKNSPVHLDHSCTKITDDSLGFTLHFSSNGGTTGEVRADLIVVTVPVPVLKTIHGFENLNLSPAKKAAIRTLGYATNAKLTVGFTERIWRKSGNKVPPNYGTVWSNGLFPEIRDSSNNQKGESGIILNYLGGKKGEIIPPSLKEKTLAHLEILYPNIRKFQDGNINLQHWTSDPFARGSYICPSPGHFASMGGFEDPSELDGRMVFAGDSFSVEFGGYMNGAIQTGKNAAQMIASSAGKKSFLKRKI